MRADARDRAAIASLKSLAAESTLPAGRVTALYALAGLAALDAETIVSALRDPVAQVRVHAVRLAEKLPEAAGVAGQLFKMTQDASLLVRYQLAFSLGEIDSSEARQ